MSFARLALRLAAVEALSPYSALAAGPWPTIAAANVYDSRIDPIAAAETPAELDSALANLDNKPLVVVYTEESDLHPYSQKYPADEQTETLVIEIMIASRGEIFIDQPAVNGVPQPPQTIGTLDTPVTDRQHEALLDVLEAQIRYIFNPLNRAPTAEAFRAVAMECRQVHSDPQRAHDRTVRLAGRTIKYHWKVKKEDWSAVGTTGLDRLPQPLQNVAKALDPASSGGVLCSTLAQFSPTPTAIPAVGYTLDLFAALARSPGADVAPTKSDGSDSDVSSQVLT